VFRRGIQSIFFSSNQMPMKTLLTYLSLLLLALPMRAQTVMDIIANSPNHIVLNTAIAEAGLTGVLSGDGPFTVFAPTDDAFANLPDDLLTELFGDTEALTNLLLYHVLDGTVLSSDLVDGQTATTIQGKYITVTINAQGVFINDAQVTTPDLVATNGVVHVVDAALLPPTTVMDIIAGSPDHETLAALLAGEGLDAALNTAGPFTVFAPTDAAFAAIPTEVIDELLADTTGALAQILLYHVLGAEVFSADLEDGQTATTLQGKYIRVTIDAEGNVFINDAQVTVADLEADNGVVHVIDAVIMPPTTVMDIIANSPDHNILEEGLVGVGLDAALNTAGPFTVFAPTDAAFQALPPDLVAELIADTTGALTNIFLYHVLGATVLSTDLVDGQTAVTLNGAEITVTINAEGVFINDAQVIVADLEADNGVVHVIDAVLLPPAAPNTVFDIIAGSDVHNTLEAAILAAGLDGALSGDGPFTVFAPTDAAFEALPAGTIDALLADPTGALTDILLYHVLGAQVLSTDLVDGQTAVTLNGAEITVTINAEGVFINDAKVIVADLLGDNGVVHVIDAVLLPPAAPNTVFDIIAGSDVHNTLEAAILAAGLDGALSGDGPFTVFAPTDAAFDALPAGTIDALLADPTGALTDILLYHVLGAQVLSTDLVDGQTAVTLNGAEITVTINAEGVFINDAQVIVVDLLGDNGVVHVIDAVLLPPAAPNTVFDIIAGSDVHNTLEAAILAAGLDGALSGDGPFTVFAPTDAAFDALPAGTIDALLADPTGALTDILLYHVLGAQVLSTDLVDGQTAVTLNGAEITVTINAEGVFINDAQVIVADLLADNGVVHVIDAVLLPPAPPIDTCTTFLGGPYNNFNTAFGGAPVPDANGDCPVNQITAFEVWASEAYVVNNFIEGVEYTFSICEGPGAGSWPAELSIIDADGNIVAFAQNVCEISWTATYSGTYFIGINEVGACGAASTNTQTDNGYPTLTCSGGVQLNTVWNIIANSPDHNTLEAAILAAGLDVPLTTGGPFTVFAPTDAAFEALPAGLVDELLADPQGDLLQILLYHVLGAQVLSTELVDGQIATTLNGQDITVTIDGGNVFINNAQVIVADLLADNGVVHVIDAVLLPELEPCDIFLGGPYNNFNTAFGGAPVPDANGECPVNQITAFEVWASEAYVVDNFIEGVEYTFSICEGPSAGSWPAELSIIDADGNLVAFAQNVCEITWTAAYNGRYFIGINEVGACGGASQNTQTDNGYPTLTCTSTAETTVWDIIQASPDHTTLETAVLAAGLDGALSGEGPLTVFAPTDAAFAALPAGLLDALLDDPSGALTEVLLYHVLGAQVLSTDLVDGQTATTLQGEDITVSITAEGVFINDAQVTVADLLADNGVVHVIDAVLAPNSVNTEDRFRSEQIRVWPNPAMDYFHLEMPLELLGDVRVMLFGMDGKLLQTWNSQTQNARYDVSALPAGAYIVQLRSQNFAAQRKLILSR
jgi:uncharacterized surface protein with fasciclin (FAS1) repeats